jgi:hypothetical protein
MIIGEVSDAGNQRTAQQCLRHFPCSAASPKNFSKSSAQPKCALSLRTSPVSVYFSEGSNAQKRHRPRRYG